jgi:hypothetical protein
MSQNQWTTASHALAYLARVGYTPAEEDPSNPLLDVETQLLGEGLGVRAKLRFSKWTWFSTLRRK